MVFDVFEVTESMDLNRVAIHEAGHVFQQLKEGADIEYVTINESNPHMRPVSETVKQLSDLQRLKILMAGAVAEICFFESAFPKTKEDFYECIDSMDGWDKDFSMANFHALKLVGCEDPSADSGPELHQHNMKEDRIYEEAQQIYETMQSNLAWIKELSELLFERQTVYDQDSNFQRMKSLMR